MDRVETLASALTDKERQVRGLDELGRALRPLVDERMTRAAHGKPWVPLYEAKETVRLGRPCRADASDPRLLLRVLRFERGVFTDIDATQRAWIDELVQASNRAAHSTSVSRLQADRALDTMTLLAESLELGAVVEQLTALQALGDRPGETAEAASAVREDAGAHSGTLSPVEGPTVVTEAEAEALDSATTPGRAVQVPLSGDVPNGMGRLSARVDELDVVVYFREAINYALVHNRVSAIAGVLVVNRGGGPVDDVVLAFELDTPPSLVATPVAAPLTIEVGTVESGAEIEIPAHQRAWRLSPAPFVTLDEAVLTGIHLTVSIGGSAASTPSRPATQVRDSADVRLLTAEEWWAVGIPESLAAFVRPNDPAVVTLLTEASALLLERTGSPSLEGYQSGSERVHQIAEAIYDAMGARRITYVEAPSSFEGTGQRIRTHAQVLEERRGTCLDLACTFAAALEQAGVHPVLALVDGHAFAGYLTDDSELPSVTVSEPSGIVTVADSDLFDAVETTLLCARDEPVSFDDARGAVRHWWREDLAKVESLLDVHAAHRRVKPLPSIRTEGGVRVVEVVREAVAAPLRRTPTPQVVPGAAGAPAIPARVERWQRALLDMTYVNPLLKMKDSSSLPVHVPAGGLARLEDKVSANHRIVLAPHDELAQIHRAQGARTAADVDPEALRRIMDEENALFVAVGERQYTTQLRGLQRKARASLEETGTDSLYLTLGTLEWKEPTGSKEGRAPLFLMPVRLTGGRGGTAFTLELDDTRTLEPNFCLVEKLRVAWGLEIPELTEPGEDESGIDVAGALAAVRTTLLRAKAMTFRVEETSRLALLQFSTLEMWRDLRDSWPRFMERPAVKHLIETPGRPYVDDIEPPAPESAAEATTYLPIPADGSQIEAVRWAAAGKSFILEGPPGTGKSQTITNLVAHCLAEGKKVLFVAEKQAALDVVKKRLDSVGLGSLSLDLHGKNQTVTAVRQQISDAFEVQAGSSSTWEALRSSYRTLVESLARYPEQVHEAGPADLSAWDARQVLLELEEAVGGSDVPTVEVPREVVMGQSPLTQVYDVARDLGNALLDLGVRPDDAPWRLAGALDPSSLDRGSIAHALQELVTADAGVVGPVLRAATAFVQSPTEADAVATWLDAARGAMGRGTAEASRIVTPAWRTQAHQARDAVGHLRATYAPRLGVFLPAVIDVDLDGYVARATEADGKLFGKKKRRLAILAELQNVMRSPASFPLKQLTPVLRDLVGVRDATRGLAKHVSTLPGVSVPYGWNPLDDAQAVVLDRAVYGLEVAADLRARLGAGRSNAEAARQTIDQVTDELLRTTQQDALLPGEQVRRLGAAWAGFTRVLGSADADVVRWLGGRSRGRAMADDVPSWTADAAGGAFIRLQRWFRVSSALARLDDLGLGAIAESVRSGALRGADVENQVRLGVARAVLDERLDSTGLSGFDHAERERLVERFVRTGDDVRQRMTAELSARIVRARTFDPTARTGMVAELRQQLGRRRGGLSVRQLLHRFGSLVTQVTPCFLMSPTSVARFLPADAVDFDVVVFDEASQIRVPEAIGAMGRGRSVVIVGDSKQMPPTSMFGPAGAMEDDDGPVDDALPVPADLESILSEGVESRLPRLLLSWHYRSKDETLIAFSNSHYYEGRLSSFPTPPVTAGRPPALELHRVAGDWEGGGRGAARVNRAEAAAVVAEVQRLLVEDAGRSIGVVTFNTQQRELILNLLEEVRQRDSLVEIALTREEEKLFVKNLENVQGDERDIILFTLAFAKDARGKVPLNWGPLSRAGGERRLNVAVTRAKEKVVVFCSFEPHELDLTNSTAKGLADLKDYLLAARNGVESAGLRRADARDRHLEDVGSALRVAGLEVRTGVGLSDFTVDLAVRAAADRAWIAVMLDGPVWAERTSVGDREGLPTSVLTGRMGWSRVERVWLPTWVRDPGPVVASIVGAAENASEQHPDAPAHAVAAGPPPSLRSSILSERVVGLELERPEAPIEDLRSRGDAVPVRGAAVVAPAPSTAALSRPVFTPAATTVRHGAWMLDDASGASRAKLRDELVEVVRIEGPVLVERLARVVAARFDLARVREGRREQILQRLPRGLAKRAPNGDVIAWPGSDPTSYDTYRVPGPGEKREIADIPYHELRNAMVEAVRGAHGMTTDDALRETARVFGILRLGAKVRERLEGTLTAAVNEGRLATHAGFVTVP
ncbi:DUF4011 domain-containing protein [Cellulosimicrobium cellulans]